ncbi:S41 family peptidase [Flavobacterium sp.]|uniref:S41 family peptidase n=1 Tax=Flavobacterium sp. TaxID=239 RepID=UPI002FD98481
MKKHFLFLIIFTSSILNSQTKLTDIQKFKQVGLVWGLMKYHHPDVSKGKYDWGGIFLELMESSEKIESQEKINVFLLDFVRKYNSKSTSFKERKIDNSKLFLKNQDYDWIDSAVFGVELTSELNKLKINGNIGNFYAKVSKLTRMVSFENEKGIKDFDLNNKHHRLLTLFSFWNAMQYWNLNKYLTDEKWFDVLDGAINNFSNANSKVTYEIAKLKIVAKLNDSHSMGFSSEVRDSLFKFYASFNVKIVNDSAVVNRFVNKKLAEENGIELGDVIVKIKNQKISTYITSTFASLISASNSNALNVGLSYSLILCNNVDSINVDIIKKNGEVVNKYIKLYEKFDFDAKTDKTDIKDNFYFVKPKIGYLNLGKMTKKDVKNAFKQFSSTKGLIVDLRKYPKNLTASDITKHLLSIRKEFIKVSLPINAYPSVCEYDAEAPLRFISDPFKAAASAKKYYKGKVILLVDRNTASRGEFIGMAIQQSPNCITIGEQTSGAPTNITLFTLPDGSEEAFTGYGGFYPNGQSVQRNGLKLDYRIIENAINYDSNMYINEAVKIIELD